MLPESAIGGPKVRRSRPALRNGIGRSRKLLFQGDGTARYGTSSEMRGQRGKPTRIDVPKIR